MTSSNDKKHLQEESTHSATQDISNSSEQQTETNAETNAETSTENHCLMEKCFWMSLNLTLMMILWAV